MIAEYGNGALTKADERVKKLQSEGFDSVAKTWELLREAIKDVQNRMTKSVGTRMPSKKGLFFRNEILIHSLEAR